MSNSDAITLAITGASGAPYALRLLQQLLHAQKDVYLLLSNPAKVVMATETDMVLSGNRQQQAETLAKHLGGQPERLHLLGKEQWFSPVASGSSAPRQMVICPCSMGTLARIAQGTSDALLERAADVILKERGQLILVPREMPLSSLHLENMLKLSQLGATIMPAAPGFYQKPDGISALIDFVVARILDHLNIEQRLVEPWGYSGSQGADGES
ncbi:MAG: aromatic acid decarboxylase [Kangiellaceae bacterium]|jgi:4-hydroxy-3-polyprenylbenzoate decarboxylase|nr:aromatic acid decarboxylase [Kangiellaceae bacterium]|tara:strand:- start:16134 stop:16772 length:639 start_codon:yes stop_codon:yes gene_type:complete